MSDCEICRYAATDHIANNFVCMYIGSEECNFEMIEEELHDTNEEKKE